MALKERFSKVLVDDQFIELDINEIKINDTILISTGEKIPLDGVVIDGIAEVDESMITGESLPIVKEKDALVLAGTILVSGNIKIKVSKTVDDTYLSSLISKVEDIQSNKPRLQKIADKIAELFKLKNIIQNEGIGVGFEDEMRDVSAQMNDAIPTSFDTDISTGSSGGYFDMVGAFKQALQEVKIELDDETCGRFVDATVTKLIYT